MANQPFDQRSEERRIGRQFLVRAGHGRMGMVILNPSFPSLPPLVLDVNPATLGRQFEKQITVNYTRGAVVEEHWGSDHLTQLSGSGSTLGFAFPTARDGGLFPEEWGLVAGRARHQTLAGENFHHLWQLFLNNGGVYHPRTGQIDAWQELMLYFDGEVHLGYFTTFDFTDAADRPFRFEYNFAFTVTASFLTRVVEK